MDMSSPTMAPLSHPNALPSNDHLAARLLTLQRIECQAPAVESDDSDYDPLDLYLSSEEDGSISDDEVSICSAEEVQVVEVQQAVIRPVSRRSRGHARVVSLTQVGKAQIVEIAIRRYSTNSPSPVTDLRLPFELSVSTEPAPMMAPVTTSMVPPARPASIRRRPNKLAALVSSTKNSTKEVSKQTKAVFLSQFSASADDVTLASKDGAPSPLGWKKQWAAEKMARSGTRPSMPRIPSPYHSEKPAPTEASKYGRWDVPSLDDMDLVNDAMYPSEQHMDADAAMDGPIRVAAKDVDDTASLKTRTRLLSRALVRKSSLMGRFS